MAQKADQLGISLHEYVMHILNAEKNQKDIRTGSELVAYWTRGNLIGTRPEIQNSQQHARDIRTQAEKRA